MKDAAKSKMPILLEILRGESDEENPLTKEELCLKLERSGVHCDPKTLARNVAALNASGYEIMQTMVGHKRAYYVADRAFSVPELKILIDAVQAANFITKKKTSELVGKIAALGGSNACEILKSNLVCFNNRKHSNEQIYFNVQSIEEALREEKRVSFLYFTINEKHERVYKKGGWRYTVDPLALIYNDDNYYLLTYHTHKKNIVTYRVDRMSKVEVMEEKNICEQAKKLREAKNFDSYMEMAFKMYTGEKKKVGLRFKKDLIGCIYDKFGENVSVTCVDDDTCEIIVDVQISSVFYGWVFQFEPNMTITFPEAVVKEYNERKAPKNAD